MASSIDMNNDRDRRPTPVKLVTEGLYALPAIVILIIMAAVLFSPSARAYRAFAQPTQEVKQEAEKKSGKTISVQVEGEDKKKSPKIEVKVNGEKKEKSSQVEVSVSGEDKAEAPKVKVEIKEDGADKAKDDGPPHILPSPSEQLSPVQTEALDEAGKKIGEQIDVLTWRWSFELGDWVNADVVNGITWLKLMVCTGLIILVAAFQKLVCAIIRWRLRKLRQKPHVPPWKTIALDALVGPLGLFIWTYGMYGALSPLFIHFREPTGENTVHRIAITAADVGGAIAIIWLVYRVIVLIEQYLRELAVSPHSKVDLLLSTILGKTIRITVLIIGSVLIIQNLTGWQAGALVASLGIGGLAVALAAKEPLTNLFGTLTILFDKPYKVGQRIVIDNYDGMVESVGYRSTKVRTWDGYLVSVPNQKIMTSNLENIAERPFIRWATEISITYDTPPEKVYRAVEILREILDNHEGMREDYTPWVFFEGFSDWSLKIMVRAWYTPPDLVPFYLWREQQCLEIMRRFEAEGIQFAFPTRTLHLANDDKRQLKLRMLQGETGTHGDSSEQEVRLP